MAELSIDSISQEHEVMREANAKVTSGELGSAFVQVMVPTFGETYYVN